NGVAQGQVLEDHVPHAEDVEEPFAAEARQPRVAQDGGPAVVGTGDGQGVSLGGGGGKGDVEVAALVGVVRQPGSGDLVGAGQQPDDVRPGVLVGEGDGLPEGEVPGGVSDGVREDVRDDGRGHEAVFQALDLEVNLLPQSPSLRVCLAAKDFRQQASHGTIPSKVRW